MKYHLFKKSQKGEFTSACGKRYDCKCSESKALLSDGWKLSLEEALRPVKKVKADDSEG